MNVTVEDILKLSSLNNCTVVAGSKGLSKTVRWFFCIMTPLIMPWVHKHEILFLYGVGVDTNDKALLSILDQCAEKEISALFFILGPYFSEVPEAVKQRAEKLDLPVIAMPNEVPLVDITKEIADLIMFNKRMVNEKSNLLRNMLFGHRSNREKQLTVLKTYHDYVKIGKFHNIICIALESKTIDLVPLTDNHIEQALFSSFGDVLYFISSDNKIILLYSSNEKDTQKLHLKINAFIKVFNELSSCKISAVGIGSQEDHLIDLNISYDNALKAMECHYNNAHELISDYDSLSSISKLLYEVDSPEVLFHCFKNTIGRVLEYDKQHNSTLLDTLKVYLEEEGSIMKSSERLFIHRNTMKYRIDKLNEVIGMKIDNLGNMGELNIAMMCYEKYISQIM